MSNPFFQTINGFDVLLVALLAISVIWGWCASVDTDRAERSARKWKDVAQMWETNYSASEELVHSLRHDNKAYWEGIEILQSELDIANRFLDKRCFCMPARGIKCLFHEFRDEQLRKQIDPWSAPAFDPWAQPADDHCRCDFCGNIFISTLHCYCDLAVDDRRLTEELS